MAATVPPNTGQRRVVATFMPSTWASMPNRALPSTFAGMSKRGAGVPIKRNSAGALRRGFAGGASAAAAATNSP